MDSTALILLKRTMLLAYVPELQLSSLVSFQIDILLGSMLLLHILAIVIQLSYVALPPIDGGSRGGETPGACAPLPPTSLKWGQ